MSSMATVLLVLIVVCAGGLSRPGTAAPEERPLVLPPATVPSAAATAFLRSCCNTQKDPINSGYCYEELLPYSESFQDNQVKVTEVATTILLIKLNAFLREANEVIVASGVVGSSGEPVNMDQKLKRCNLGIGNATYWGFTDLAMESLDRLAAAGDGKRSKEDLENVLKWIKNVESQCNGSASGCELDYVNKQYGDKLPSAKNLDKVIITAISLVNAIKL